MKLIHSLWSKPLLNSAPVDRQAKAVTMLWCYASSVAFARYHKQPIRLYADEHAADMLSFLPYDEILPLSVPEGTPTIFWAAGKFSAYAQMQPGDIHIDGDVFLQSNAVVLLLNYAEKKKYDLLIQCIENEGNANGDVYDAAIDVLNGHGITYNGAKFPKFSQAYNTGLIGFNDMQLRDRYVSLYFDTMEQIRSNPGTIADLDKATTAPDIILEQQALFGLARKSTVYSLLGAGEFSMAYSSCLGYQHLLGGEKQSFLYNTIDQLFELDPEIFVKTAEKVNQFLLNNTL